MSRNILLVVEGKKTEQKILGEIFKKYDFEVIKKEPIKSNLDNIDEIFNIEEYKNKNDSITIITGSHSRLNHLINSYNKNTDDFSKLFNLTNNIFSGVFYIYDVDHTTNENLENLFEILNDETSAMLLVSSPCIEIISDPNRKAPIIVNHLKEYKSERNIYCQNKYKINGGNDYEKICMFSMWLCS